MTEEERFMCLLRFLGWDEWTKEWKEDFCWWCAALLKANSAGLTGDDCIPFANSWLADHDYKPLPFSTLPS